LTNNSLERLQLKISTRVLYDEFKKQNVPVSIIDATLSMLEYVDHAGNQRLLFSTCSDRSSAVGNVIARSKIRTAMIAERLAITVPQSEVCDVYEEAEEFLKKHKLVVVKPIAASGGTGVTTFISTKTALKEAVTFAKKYGDKFLVQQHKEGDDVRLLILGGKFVSAVIREPAHVIGDGKSTIQQLINQENLSPDRVPGAMLTKLPIDQHGAKRYLHSKLQDIPQLNENVRVMGPANISLGGVVHEATPLVTQSMIDDAEKITKKLQLDLCGVDLLWDQKTGKHTLIEVNGTPGIDIHDEPVWGTTSGVIKKYVDWLVSA
jgi:cyanophycin synthetase